MPFFWTGSCQVLTEQGKKRIRQRFSRAATTYDAHAHVQKGLASRLLLELPAACDPDRILEIGCGTGAFTGMLAGRYPGARIIGVDFAENMLRLAREKLGDKDNLSLVCADGERFLEACPGPFALICSNSTMQWFDDQKSAFAHLARLLPKGGCFAGTLFGPRTFQELAQGLSTVFGRRVALASQNFTSRAGLEEILFPLFRRVSVREEDIVRLYGSLTGLLEHIRRTGTSGGESLPGPLTRGRLRELDAWFQGEFSGYPATFQIFILRCEK